MGGRCVKLDLQLCLFRHQSSSFSVVSHVSLRHFRRVILFRAGDSDGISWVVVRKAMPSCASFTSQEPAKEKVSMRETSQQTLKGGRIRLRPQKWLSQASREMLRQKMYNFAQLKVWCQLTLNTSSGW